MPRVCVRQASQSTARFRTVLISEDPTNSIVLGRFRVKSGEWEIEYEGEDANKRFDEILEWAKDQKTSQTLDNPTRPSASSTERRGTTRPSPGAKSSELNLPTKGRLGLLEFTESEVRFPSAAIVKLTVPEATALLLFEVGGPLKKMDIDSLVNRGFKRVRPDVLKNYLTSKKYPLARMVIRQEDGYRLTGEGDKWVEDQIVPKLKEE